MVAPVIGPALGGYLTETYSWRMVFYINIPIGVLALLLSVGYLPRRPVADIKTDWVGMSSPSSPGPPSSSAAGTGPTTSSISLCSGTAISSWARSP
jgi:MFS family permease